MYRVVLCTFIFMSMALSSASSLPESPISSPPESRKKSLQSQLGADADSARCDAEDVQTITAPADTQTFFGVGGRTNPYSNDQRCVWEVRPSDISTGGCISLVFTFFELENNEDKVMVYNMENNLLDTFTGEILCPKVVRYEGITQVRVVFMADNELHVKHETLQLGFKATYFDSSEDDTCYNDCSGHGTCESNGMCQCELGWIGGDCSIEAPLITNDNTQYLTDLCIGCWAYFTIECTDEMTIVLELVDTGSADSSAYLLLGGNTPPTLTPGTFIATDWFDWFYDRSDVHYLKGAMTPGIFYAAVTNNELRATAPLSAQLTLRTGAPGKFRCIADCYGRGECMDRGYCVCEDGYASSSGNRPSSCEFEIESLSFDQSRESSLRVGDWDYYKFTVEDHQAHERTLLFEMTSRSPHSQPIMLVRKGRAPELSRGFLPSADAFYFDYQDTEGFYLRRGQRQAVTVPKEEVTAGDWYVGIFNIWGYTGFDEFESHSECEYLFYSDAYSAGIPCPRADNSFCNGYECNFNTGTCQCPPEYLGIDCAVHAPLMNENTEYTGDLGVEEADYYTIQVTKDMIEGGFNLEVVLQKEINSKAYPYLLIREGEIPYANNYTLFDDHDLTANFYHETTHSLLLDTDELSEGTWYLGVLNAESSTENLKYTLNIAFKDKVDCPLGKIGDGKDKMCSGRGECDYSNGRCNCDAGFTLDDCSAEGVFHLESGKPLTKAVNREVPVDDWVFWNMYVGCQNLTFQLDFQTSDSFTAPLLVIRKKRLPLMLEESMKFFDYYHGLTRHSLKQSIRVEPCIESRYGGEDNCIVHDSGSGTIFSMGSPEPGVYYIGLYNDFSLAHEAIKDYNISFNVIGQCNGDCAYGFVGDNCDRACPGMLPEHAYSNAPMDEPTSCSDNGQCMYSRTTDEAVCMCDPWQYGDDCSITCPGIDPEDPSSSPCSHHGQCTLEKKTSGGVETTYAVCECELGYYGDECQYQCSGSTPCNDHGVCDLKTDVPKQEDAPAFIPSRDLTCKCMFGYKGESCEYECPGYQPPNKQNADKEDDKASVCHEHGACSLSTGDDEVFAMCACKEGFVGDACELACPGMNMTGKDSSVDPYSLGVCSGNGTCEVDNAGAAVCRCFQGMGGVYCDQPPQMIIDKYDDSKEQAQISDLTKMVIALSVGGCFVIFGLAYACVVMRKQKLELMQYRQPLMVDDIFNGVAVGSDAVGTPASRRVRRGRNSSSRNSAPGGVIKVGPSPSHSSSSSSSSSSFSSSASSSMPPASKEARPSKSEYDPQVDDRSWDPEAHAHAVNIHNQNLGAEGDASRKGSVGRRISNSLSQLTGRQSRSSTVDVEMADLSVSGADAIDGGSAEK